MPTYRITSNRLYIISLLLIASIIAVSTQPLISHAEPYAERHGYVTLIYSKPTYGPDDIKACGTTYVYMPWDYYNHSLDPPIKDPGPEITTDIYLMKKLENIAINFIKTLVYEVRKNVTEHFYIALHLGIMDIDGKIGSYVVTIAPNNINKQKIINTINQVIDYYDKKYEYRSYVIVTLLPPDLFKPMTPDHINTLKSIISKNRPQTFYMNRLAFLSLNYFIGNITLFLEKLKINIDENGSSKIIIKDNNKIYEVPYYNISAVINIIDIMNKLGINEIFSIVKLYEYAPFESLPYVIIEVYIKEKGIKNINIEDLSILIDSVKHEFIDCDTPVMVKVMIGSTLLTSQMHYVNKNNKIKLNNLLNMIIKLLLIIIKV